MLKPFELLQNLRHFTYNRTYGLPSVWPANRRSAVLILLFIGSQGELRVLLTKRSRNLRSFSGHVSLPGGKADNDSETFEDVVRREAEEEIGLPRDPEILAEKFQMGIENICFEIPCYVSRTLLSVKPLVCFLHNQIQDASKENIYESPLNVSQFFGRLNPGETSSIFSIPINDLIAIKYPKALEYKPEYITHKEFVGRWGGLKWDIRHLYYPVINSKEEIWLNDVENLSSDEEWEDIGKARDVWGLTAKILTDVSLIANGMNVESPPSKNSNLHFNHEKLIYGLHHYGNQMQPDGRSDWEKRLINNNPKVKYDDKLPAFYMDYLRHSGNF